MAGKICAAQNHRSYGSGNQSVCCFQHDLSFWFILLWTCFLLVPRRSFYISTRFQHDFWFVLLWICFLLVPYFVFSAFNYQRREPLSNVFLTVLLGFYGNVLLSECVWGIVVCCQQLTCALCCSLLLHLSCLVILLCGIHNYIIICEQYQHEQ